MSRRMSETGSCQLHFMRSTSNIQPLRSSYTLDSSFTQGTTLTHDALALGLLQGMLPNGWDCSQDNTSGIQCDGLYLRNSPPADNSGVSDGLQVILIKANQFINISNIMPIIHSTRHLMGNAISEPTLTLAPPTLSNQSSASTLQTLNGHLECVYYYELFIISGFFSVGFDGDKGTETSTSQPPYNVCPGMLSGSIGLNCNGDLWVSGVIFPNWTEPFRNGDTIGCGVVLGNSCRYFFTRNGDEVDGSMSTNGSMTCNLTSFVPCIGVSSLGETVLRTNFGCQPDRRFVWNGCNGSVRIISSASFIDESIQLSAASCSTTTVPTDQDNSFSLMPQLIRGHTVSGDTRGMGIASTSEEGIRQASDAVWNSATTLHSDRPSRRRSDVLPSSSNQAIYLSCAREMNCDTQNLKKEEDTNAFKDMGPLDLNDVKELARELHSAAFASDAHSGAISELTDVCKTNLVRVSNLVQDATMQEDTEHDLGELLSVHELVTDAIEAAEEKKKESNINVYNEERDVMGLLCHLRSKQKRKAAWGLLRFTKKGLDTERCQEVLNAGGMRSLLTFFKTNEESTELMLVSALTVVYLFPVLLDSEVQSSSYVHMGVISCLEFLLQTPDASIDIDISPHEIRTASVFTMTNLWFKVLVPKLRSSDMIMAKGIMKRYEPGDNGDLFSDIPFPSRRRSSLSSKNGEEVDCSIMIDAFTSLSVTVTADLMQNEELRHANDINVYYEFALIIESIIAVEYARPMAMSKGVLELLLQWLDSGEIDLTRPAASALRNLTLTGESYVAGWVHSQLLNDNALPLIVEQLESNDSQVRLAMADIISSLSVAPHTRAGIIKAKGVEYLVQLLGSLDFKAHDEALALTAGTALLRLAMAATSGSGGTHDVQAVTRHSSSKEDCIVDYIIEHGALNTFVSMARSKDHGSLRYLAAKILRVISEGCSGYVKYDGKERCLCEAEAVSALGRILSYDINIVQSLFENSLASSDTTDLINDSLSNDCLTSKMTGTNTLRSEIRHALRGLVNILHSSSDSTTFLDTQLMACAQLIASGGIKSLLWITCVTDESCSKLEVITRGEPIFSRDIQVNACKCLSSLCPLLLSQNKQISGAAKWTPFVTTALIKFLKGESLTYNISKGMIPDVCLDILQGLSSLAEYGPLKTCIIDEFMPHLIDIYRQGNQDMCDAVNHVCRALGFSHEIESAFTLGDKFILARSRLIQALVRDEIRNLLKKIWMPALKAKADENDTTEQSYDTSNELRPLFPYLAQERDTARERDEIRHQFMSCYDFQPVSSAPRLQSSTSLGRKQKMKRNMYRRTSTSSVEVEGKDLDRVWGLGGSDRSNSGGMSTNRMGEISEHVLSDFVGNGFSYTSMLSDDSNFLQCHQYPLNGKVQEKDWIIEHCQAFHQGQKSDAPYSPWMPCRVKDLLRVCFPSVLIQDQVIPLYELNSSASFNFRAFTMPNGRYYSFRNEARLIAKECENLNLLDRVHHTLCFRNSSYAGDFAESLLQALYLFPIIQGLSFSNDDFEDENERDSSSHAYEGSELLPFLIRAIPSSVSHLTFDNVLSNSAALSLANVLKSVYDEVDDEDTIGSTSKNVKGSFHSLAVINSPHINQAIFSSLVESIDGNSSPLQFLRTLDLSGNLLGDAGSAKVLSIALNPSSSMTIERLDISRNGIGEGNAVSSVLQQCVSNDPKLKVLNMSCNNFGESDVAFQLVSSLGDVLSTLSSLDLSGNDLSSAFLTALGGVLPINCHLVNLNVSNNQFGSSSINSFLSKLHNVSKTNVSMQLSFVHLEGNKSALDINQEMILNEILSENRQCHVAKYLKKQSSSVSQSLESDVLSSISDITGEQKADRKLPPAEVITVLFSAPLVWRDGDDDFHPIEMLDFKLEKSLLWQCFSEASRNIDLAYDNATTDRLQAVMTRGCKYLHFSGHGHPYSLTFEDGSGGIHWFSVDQLRALISSGLGDGESPFEFVFVSACHSALAGHTFVDCGVPHVVCCQQESQLMDSAALSFTRAFYLALAFGRTLKDAFDIGKHAVLSSATVSNPDEEMQKFMLLPEDGDHDVPIFTAEQVSEWPPIGGVRSEGNNSLPAPPQGFLGREVDMYHGLNLVLNRRFVNIVGPSGIGRSSLAAALCQYIDDRKSTLLFDDIYYVKMKRPAAGDAFSPIISLHNQLVTAGRVQATEGAADLDDIIRDILTSLKHTKSLLVFDKLEMLDGTSEAQDLHFFLGKIFDQTNDVHVLVTSNKSIGFSPLVTVGESVYNLEPLNFRNTVKLFAFHCPHLHSSRERKDLLEELGGRNKFAEDDEVAQIIKSTLGGGVPAKTFAIAFEMTEEEFQELRAMGDVKEKNYDSSEEN